MIRPIFLLLAVTSAAWAYEPTGIEYVPAEVAYPASYVEYRPIDVDIYDLGLTAPTDWQQVFLPNYDEQSYETELRVQFGPHLDR